MSFPSPDQVFLCQNQTRSQPQCCHIIKHIEFVYNVHHKETMCTDFEGLLQINRYCQALTKLQSKKSVKVRNTCKRLQGVNVVNMRLCLKATHIVTPAQPQWKICPLTCKNVYILCRCIDKVNGHDLQCLSSSQKYLNSS